MKRTVNERDQQLMNYAAIICFIRLDFCHLLGIIEQCYSISLIDRMLSLTIHRNHEYTQLSNY